MEFYIYRGDYMSEADIEKEIEALEEKLEDLQKQQIEVIGLGGDDLWIRDEIAEIEDELIEKRKELRDLLDE